MIRCTRIRSVYDIFFAYNTLLYVSSRYSLDFHVTEDGHIDTKHNKEEIKAFCDKFCQLMVDSIQEGWRIASLCLMKFF